MSLTVHAFVIMNAIMFLCSGAPELKSYKTVNREALYSFNPEEGSMQVVEVAFSDSTGVEEDSGFVAPATHIAPSKSSDSLLSLSDVEVGMEDSGHFGDLEEVDASHVETSINLRRKVGCGMSLG